MKVSPNLDISNPLKKCRSYIRSLLKEIITEVVVESMADHRKTLDKLTDAVILLDKRINEIPSFICFICGQGIREGRILYMGKNLHPGRCFDEYCRIVELPDQDYKIVHGERVKEFFPKKDIENK